MTRSKPREREVTSRNGKVFVERLRPYRMAADGQLGGVVLTFIEVTEIKRVEAALRDSERRLEAELKVMRLLHRMSMAVATAAGMQEALDQILATAIELLDADFGNVQLFEVSSERLRIVAQQGFLAPFLNSFELVGLEDQTSCGRVLRTRDAVCIEDVTLDQEYAPYRAAAAEAGYRAVQSEPLIGKNGELVGVLSIHFREPRIFSERDRQLGELVARQAADLIVSRTQQENITRLNEALSRRTAELEFSERQLSRKATELLEQDRNKEGFLAALGHQLRNPMAAIQLVELHGGTVEFRSEGRGLGSTVTLTLPLPRPGASAATPADFVTPAPRRILVVDDQRDVADMFAAMLENLGQQVQVAYDGERALELALEQRPQIAILDISMPGMDGVELARRLRQKFPATELSLVSLTGYARDYEGFKYTEFEYHLLKPITLERIAALLNSLPEKDHSHS